MGTRLSRGAIANPIQRYSILKLSVIDFRVLHHAHHFAPSVRSWVDAEKNWLAIATARRERQQWTEHL